MRTDDFDYHLPEGLIARWPAPRRDASRLLVSRLGEAAEHRRFDDLPDLLTGEEVVVVNDTRVLPARVFGRKAGGGGRVELLFVRQRETPRQWIAMTGSNRPLRPGAVVELDGGASVQVRARLADGSALLDLDGLGDDVPGWLRTHGELPLPPYLERAAEPEDEDRYQTMFAQRDGAVAAPTAGLHFTPEVMDRITARGCLVRHVTLHVGPGTFRPVTTDDPRQHVLDPERYEIPKDTARALQEERPVLAVGTTVVRALEHAASVGEGAVRPGPGVADLLMLPGARPKVVAGLLTNFHLPRSSLLMLVCALAGTARTLAAYQEAVARQYRFYSYGDATLWL